ncbi:hypothetical protein SNOG_15409 [Parastagonospora nodorum SN15]|uniref:Uncharacterized protein n=1 Tax=Phaeosphaeria nodorum (strain SN15 / ATCC MYA-4574 / FGSC 10173) TaxID=321614 RepID=Q0TYY9_PHANO|nr:hypothetical protein SNOG_15409 [Parastagonospora nodorum SN15]EAT77342.1 hypothetical protein SNOG_15409 [Parastagonospora nodorum SN15]
MPGMYAFWRAKISNTRDSALGYDHGSDPWEIQKRSMGIGKSAQKGRKSWEDAGGEY